MSPSSESLPRPPNLSQVPPLASHSPALPTLSHHCLYRYLSSPLDCESQEAGLRMSQSPLYSQHCPAQGRCLGNSCKRNNSKWRLNGNSCTQLSTSPLLRVWPCESYQTSLSLSFIKWWNSSYLTALAIISRTNNVFKRPCTKQSMHINSFNLHSNLWGGTTFYSHFTDAEIDLQQLTQNDTARWQSCVWSPVSLKSHYLTWRLMKCCISWLTPGMDSGARLPRSGFHYWLGQLLAVGPVS